MKLEDHVQWFSEEMLRKLRMNQHKGNEEGWREMDIIDLFMRLREEVIELGDELQKCDFSAIIKECADVANFAMMIADKSNQAIIGIDRERRERESNAGNTSRLSNPS